MKNAKDSKLKTTLGIKWYYFFFLTIAGIINAVGVVLFLAPCNLYDGGFSGTSILLSKITPLSMSVFLIILNFPFFLLGTKKLGARFIIYSLYTISIYSLFSFLFQSVLPIDFSEGSPIAGKDMLLCSIFGGVISGIGSGLTIRFSGAIDGIEVLAVLFAKKIGLTVGTFVMIFNIILYIIAGFITKSFTAPLYSVIAYAIGLKAVDFMIEGFDKAKSAHIITEKEEEIAEHLSAEFGRGLTIIKAEGYYSKSEKTVLFCVVNRFEINKLKSTVSSIDPQAFLVINEVTDTMGNSLNYDKVIKRKIRAINKSKRLSNLIKKEELPSAQVAEIINEKDITIKSVCQESNQKDEKSSESVNSDIDKKV